MIDVAIELLFVLATMLVWYVAQKSNLRVFRILFMLVGFGFLYAAFASGATFTSSYNVPANTTSISYNVNDINSLTTLLYTFGSLVIFVAIFYLMIEVLIYLYQVWVLMSKHVKPKDAFMLKDTSED